MARSTVTVKTESPQSSQTPSLRKSASGSQSEQNQKSILGFFQKKGTIARQEMKHSAPKINGSGSSTQILEKKTLVQRTPTTLPSQTLTPAPSSDTLEAVDDIDEDDFNILNKMEGVIGLPSPTTLAANAANDAATISSELLTFNSPSRKVNILRYTHS